MIVIFSDVVEGRVLWAEAPADQPIDRRELELIMLERPVVQDKRNHQRASGLSKHGKREHAAKDEHVEHRFSTQYWN